MADREMKQWFYIKGLNYIYSSDDGRTFEASFIGGVPKGNMNDYRYGSRYPLLPLTFDFIISTDLHKMTRIEDIREALISLINS